MSLSSSSRGLPSTPSHGELKAIGGEALILSALVPVPAAKQRKWCAKAATCCHEQDVLCAGKALAGLSYKSWEDVKALQFDALQAYPSDRDKELCRNCTKLNMLSDPSCCVPLTVAWIYNTFDPTGEHTGERLHYVAYLVQRLPGSPDVQYEYFDSKAKPANVHPHVRQHVRETIDPAVAWLRYCLSEEVSQPWEILRRAPGFDEANKVIKLDKFKDVYPTLLEPELVLQRNVQQDVTMCGIWCLWYVRHRLTMSVGSVQAAAGQADIDRGGRQRQAVLREIFFKAPTKAERKRRRLERKHEQDEAKRARTGLPQPSIEPSVISLDDSDDQLQE